MMLFKAMKQLSLFVESLPSDHPYRLAEEVRRLDKKRWDRKIPIENSVFERINLALKVYEEEGKKKDDQIYDQLVFYQRLYKELLKDQEFFALHDPEELSQSF